MNWLDNFIVSKRGQWDYPGYPTAVPTKNGRITMEGVPYPVMGFVPGQPPVMMQPGKNYKFPGKMVYEIPMHFADGGYVLPGRFKNPEGNWVSKYQNGGPRIDKLPIQQVDGKVEIAYDGSTVYIRKIGDEKFTSLNPEKSKAFLQKYQGFIPPTLTQVEEQKKKQAAYNAKLAKEKEEFERLKKYTPGPTSDRAKQLVKDSAKQQRAELEEKSFVEKAWDALPDASSITDPIARAYHALPDVGDVAKVASGIMNLPKDVAKAGASYMWNNFKIPQVDLPFVGTFGDLTPNEIYQSFQNRLVEKNFGDQGLLGESNMEEMNVLSDEDETSGTSSMLSLPKSRANYGPQRLPQRKDASGNLLPAYQPIAPGDSLARFTYTFNNDIAGADSLPPTHFVTPKIKELTGNPARPRKWDNAFAVGDFLRDADITENQFYHPDKYYVGTAGHPLLNSDLGKKSNKLISASNQLVNDPEKYWALYKWDPKNPEAAWVRYMKMSDVRSQKDRLVENGWNLDMPVSGQHRFDDVDWTGKGSDTGYQRDSEWVPLKKDAHIIKSQKDIQHTYIPKGTRKGEDSLSSYNLFSGGSITFIWTDPETNEKLASTITGSVNDMSSYGEKIKKDFGLKEKELEIIYHDTGSYSGKPAAKDGTLYYDQWKDYNKYNKGYSGAALIVPTQDWLENWTPNKKEGGQLDNYQSKNTSAITKGWHQKEYTDPEKFAKANKAFNDSLDLVNKSYDFLKKESPGHSYHSTVPYDDVHWTADGPGGHFIDTPFGSKRWFLGTTSGIDTMFRKPGTEFNKIFNESFTNRIKPIGFLTADYPFPIYKVPTEEPVYKEIKNLPYLDAKFELPELKLDIGKPSVKSQGIRIRPMMTADQTTSTGQYQSGKYMWDPNTKSWKVKMLSPEAQQENREEVKLKSKKNGGWLDQYQGTNQSSQVKTYASDPNYFNSHAVLVDNSQANELFKSKIYAGTHGWDPSTNSLVKLDKPVAVPKAVQEMSTADYGKKSYKERFESNTPAGKEVRKAAVAQGMKDMVQNPLLYAPGAVAAGVLAAPAIAGAAPAISGALSAPFTYGSTVLPGVTAAGILDAAGATLATQQLLDPTSMTRQSVSRASENPTTGNVLAAVGEVGLTGLDYLGLGIGSEVFQGARRVGNKFLNSNLGQALTPFSQSNIQNQLTSARDRIRGIYSEDMPFYGDLNDGIASEIFQRELNPAFKNYMARKPFTDGSGSNSLDAIINKTKTLYKSQNIETAKNFSLDNGDLVAGSKGAFFRNPSVGTDSPVLSSGSASIVDLKSGQSIMGEVKPSSVASRIKLDTGADGKKVISVLDESKSIPEVDSNYINTLQNNIQHIEETVPGAKVFGSSRGVAEGNLPHLSSDYDILISESDYLKNVKNKYPEKGIVGSAHKHDISGKADNQLDDYVLDFNVIHENPDGTVKPVWIKTGSGGESSREVELFRQAFPEEFFEASKQSILSGKPIQINKTPKELIEKLDPTVKSIMDSYESTKSKHINRIDAYINYGDPTKVSTAQNSFVKSLVGPKGSVGHQFDASAFSDVDNNKAILDEIGFVGDKSVIAKDPKRMQLALNDYYINSTVLTRNVQTGKDRLGNISNVENAFKKWNYKNPSGTAAGTGLNHVKLGIPFDGTNFDNLVIGNKQIGLNLDTSNVNNYIASIKKQTDGNYILDKDELDIVKQLMDQSFGQGFSNKFTSSLRGADSDQVKVPVYDLINLHQKGFHNDVVDFKNNVANDYTRYHNFNKSLEETLGIRAVSGDDYGNSEFSATLGDFNDKLDALGFGIRENMPQLKSAKDRQNNFNYKLRDNTDLDRVEKMVNSENFKQIEGYLKGGMSKAEQRLKALAEEKQMLVAQSEKIRRNYSKDLYSELDQVTAKIKTLENEVDVLNAKRNQLYDTSKKITELRKMLVVGGSAVGFAGALVYGVNTGQIGASDMGEQNTNVPANTDSTMIPKKKYGGWLDKYQGVNETSQVERRDPNQPFFPSATEQDMYESQYSQPEVTITPDWTEAELERNRLRDEYIKKDKNVFRHWYDKLGYDKDNVTKRANQFAYNKLAKEYLRGDKDKLTPEQRKFIEKSEYANRLQPSVGSRFVEGVTNPGFNMETVANVLAPFEYPGNLVRGAVTGEFVDALTGQTPSPYFVSSDLAGTSPNEAAIASGLMTVGTDPLFLTGDEVFQGVGKGAKGLRKFFTKPSATKVPSKPLNEITADVDALNAIIKPRSEATTEDMQSLLDRLQSINRSLEEHIDPNSLEDLDDMSFDPSITDDISSVDPDIYKSMKDRLKGLERNIQNDEAARDREMDKILDKEVPQEFMVEARAAGAKGPEQTGFFSESEINEKLAQYQDYLEKRKYFDDMYPEDPGNMIMDIFSGGADREAREQLFENLFPNVKKPNWWGKEYRPEDRAYLANKLKYEPDTPFHKFNDKTSEMGLKGLLNFEKQTNTQLPTQKYIRQVEQEMSDPASWYNTNPKDFVMEFREWLDPRVVELLDFYDEQGFRDLAKQIQETRIKEWKKSIQDQLNQKGPKPDITLPSERLNKYGGSIKWLDKYQDGGSRDMPLGLPLREQNPYLLPEYNQPMANGYILPDPNRPQLLNTGATEYKYSYGMDNRDVQVPSVVAGQYIGDKAFDRYMISGEEFKPMADPSSYSKYYDMLMELGLMQKKKGGEPYPSLGYFEYIGGYRGVSS